MYHHRGVVCVDFKVSVYYIIVFAKGMCFWGMYFSYEEGESIFSY